jgi:signal transduction histidine kinase
MNHSKVTPFLKEERKKTDDSLVAERDKTNKSLTKSKKNNEHEADRQVQSERIQADRTTSDLREAEDFNSNKKRTDSEYVVKNEKKISRDQLFNEREQADKALELERTQVDLAVDKERDLKSLLANQLLEQERKLTDKSLSSERIKTDTEVERTTGLLSDEISDHSKTKISLTTRDEFLAIVSHDLRNPIGTASMGAEILLENPAFLALGTEVRKSVELIKRNIDTSLRLISDLLDMERIEGGKIQLVMEKHSLSQIIKEAVGSYAQAAQAKNIILQTIPTDIFGEVFCDKDRIMQVFSNLIGNAMKFTPKEGAINIEITFNKTEVQISICDSGPGIPEEKKHQIFERYAQLGVNNRVGLGLGLYISKMLVEAHHGRLWVSSKLGNGSTFSFTLPHHPDRQGKSV